MRHLDVVRLFLNYEANITSEIPLAMAYGRRDLDLMRLEEMGRVQQYGPLGLISHDASCRD